MSWKITFLKRLDTLLGGVAAACLPPPRRGGVRDPRRVLLIRPGGIGDAVLLVPAVRALKRAFPECRIELLAEKRNAAAFALCPEIDAVHRYDSRRGLLSVLGGYDVVIDTEQWHRLSAVVARLTGAPLSIGFATNGRRRLFSHRIGYSHDDYEASSFQNLLVPLGIQPSAGVTVPFLSVPAEAARKAGRLLPETGQPFIAVFPGASIAERRWGAARFREVAERLGRLGHAVVVVGGRDDAGEGDRIVAGCGGVNLAGRTSLGETAAVIERASLLLSGDSGILHIAVGLGVPTVSLFGPGIEAKWGPQGERHLVLNGRAPCSPCTRFGTTPPCPIGAKCLADIGVDEVLAGIRDILQRAGRG